MIRTEQETISFIATMRAAPGKADQLERVLRTLALQVRAEPGCITYVVTRARKDPDIFRVIEGYLDQHALAAHAATVHMHEVKPLLVGLLAEKLLIEISDVVA